MSLEDHDPFGSYETMRSEGKVVCAATSSCMKRINFVTLMPTPTP
jgi:hypothetical protein